MARAFQQSQQLANDSGSRFTLQRLIGFEVDACNQDGTLSCLPQEGLVATTLNGESFKLS